MAWSFTKGVVVDGAWGTVKGTAELAWNLATSPVQTTKAIGSGVAQAVMHPVDTYESVKQGLKKQWDEDPARAIGNGIFQVATAVVPVTKASTVSKVAKAADDVGEVAAAARRIRNAERVAMNEACPGGVCRAPGQCFAAGTPVVTAQGEKAIEKVTAGDVVLARDPESGETTYERVAQTFVREADVVDVALAGPRGAEEHIVVTLEHPFFVHGRGFRSVRDLAPGDDVDTASGVVHVVALASLPERRTVYNFEVEHAHTYFVGHNAAWVHNACTPPGEAAAAGKTVQMGEGATSRVYRNGDTVTKVVKDQVAADGGNLAKITDAERDFIAKNTAEISNSIHDELPVVPKMSSTRPGEIDQPFVSGKELSQLKGDAAKNARANMKDAVDKAHDAVGLGRNQNGEFPDNGFIVKIDTNSANFRFDEHGNITSWFDPVSIVPPRSRGLPPP